MPVYTDLAALTARFGAAMLIQATDRGAVSTGEIDAAVVAAACIEASDLIDGYLAGRYALPLVSVPPLVAALAKDIAIWKLHPYEPDGKLKADYEAAMRSLREIAAGTIRLPLAGISTGAEPAAVGGTGAEFTDRDRPMTEASLKGFI